MKKKVLIIVSQVNINVVSVLESDAVRYIGSYEGVSYDIVHVPGAFELPSALSMALDANCHDGYIVLGCILRGSTSHYDIIASEAASNINRMASEYKIPLGYGVISAENMEQAMARVGENSRNNYAKSAVNAVVEMMKIKDHFLELKSSKHG